MTAIYCRDRRGREGRLSTRILPAIWMGKMHGKSEGLDVNLWYSNLELTLNCLKACFCRQGHGLTPRAGRKLVDLKSEHRLSAWITHFSTTLLSPNRARDPKSRSFPKPGERLGPVHKLAGIRVCSSDLGLDSDLCRASDSKSRAGDTAIPDSD